MRLGRVESCLPSQRSISNKDVSARSLAAALDLAGPASGAQDAQQRTIKALPRPKYITGVAIRRPVRVAPGDAQSLAASETCSCLPWHRPPPKPDPLRRATTALPRPKYSTGVAFRRLLRAAPSDAYLLAGSKRLAAALHGAARLRSPTSGGPLVRARPENCPPGLFLCRLKTAPAAFFYAWKPLGTAPPRPFSMPPFCSLAGAPAIVQGGHTASTPCPL
jgi:hypothetical protein